jgi:hypothetical protein
MAIIDDDRKQPAKRPGDYQEERVELESDPSPDEDDVGRDDADGETSAAHGEEAR